MAFIDREYEFKRKRAAWRLAGFCCILCKHATRAWHKSQSRCDRGKNPRRAR